MKGRESAQCSVFSAQSSLRHHRPNPIRTEHLAPFARGNEQEVQA
jgi:hypothetical protein